MAPTVQHQRHAGRKTTADDDSANYRQRLLDALAESINQHGYPKTTVADVVRRARTSRRTFYEHFSDKETCFIALLTEANGEMIRHILAAVDRGVPWQIQIRQAVEAWVACVESRPTLMLSWIREGPALGEAARRLQRDAMEAFIVMVHRLCDTDELRSAGVSPVSRRRAIMLLGGLRELTAVTVESGERVSDNIDDAVDAAIALLGPRT